jgi:uncharacterized protein
MACNRTKAQKVPPRDAAGEANEKEKCMMGAAENKKLMQHIFSELSKGNSRPFVECMAEEFSWTIMGTTKWSKKYAGKQAVIGDLLGALRAKLAPPIIVDAHRFIADGDYVVVEARGKNTTKDARPYENAYCYVFRLMDGKLREMTEYLDTELVTAALGDPSEGVSR